MQVGQAGREAGGGGAVDVVGDRPPQSAVPPPRQGRARRSSGVVRGAGEPREGRRQRAGARRRGFHAARGYRTRSCRWCQAGDPVGVGGAAGHRVVVVGEPATRAGDRGRRVRAGAGADRPGRREVVEEGAPSPQVTWIWLGPSPAVPIAGAPVGVHS